MVRPCFARGFVNPADAEQLKVEVTPTFFINGEMLKGTMILRA